MASSSRALRIAGLLALFGALSQPALAQTTMRRALLGWVAGPDGKPLGGAEVLMAACLPTASGCAELDRLTATADARGRFKVQALPNARYQAIAFGPPGEDGVRLAGPLAAGVAGGILQVDCTTPCRSVRVAVEGLSPWRDLGPFSLRIHVGDMAWPGVTALDADDQAALPVLPLADLAFDVIDGSGQLLGSFTREAERMRRHVAADARSPIAVALSVRPPQQIPFGAVDAQGAPGAGVEVRRRIRSRQLAAKWLLRGGTERTEWRTLGKTDDDGRLVGRAPAAADPFEDCRESLFFCASAPGRMASWAGFAEQPFCDGKLLASKPNSLRFVMREAVPFTVHLPAPLGAASLPQRAVVRAPIKVEMADNNGWMHEWLAFERTVDAAGRIVVEEMPATFAPCDFCLWPSPHQDRWIPNDVRRSAPPSPVVVRPLTADATLDPGSFPLLRLAVRDEAELPCAQAEVLAVDLTRSHWDLNFMPHWTTDSDGLSAVRLSPGPWGLLLRSETGFAWLRVDAQRDEELRLRLQPLPSLRGRLVGEDGAPVRDARAYVSSSGMSVAAGAVGGDDVPGSLASSLIHAWCMQARSGADGTFVVPFLSAPGLVCRVKWFADGSTSAELELEDVRLPDPVVLKR